MEQMPFWVSALFILTTMLTLYFLITASHFNKRLMVGAFAWLLIQTIAGISGFYQHISGTPPRFMLAVVPPLVFILMLLVTKKGRLFLDRLDLSALTILHIVRIPVELVLFGLFVHHAVPKIMTFEGNNLDILSGLTAILIWLVGRRMGWFGPSTAGEPVGSAAHGRNRWILLIWNLICLALLLNIVVTAILSAPFAFQRFGFDQPNIALLYFPYNWLPAFVVPAVLLAHVAAIRQIVVRGK